MGWASIAVSRTTRTNIRNDGPDNQSGLGGFHERNHADGLRGKLRLQWRNSIWRCVLAGERQTCTPTGLWNQTRLIQRFRGWECYQPAIDLRQSNDGHEDHV